MSYVVEQATGAIHAADHELAPGTDVYAIEDATDADAERFCPVCFPPAPAGDCE